MVFGSVLTARPVAARASLHSVQWEKILHFENRSFLAFTALCASHLKREREKERRNKLYWTLVTQFESVVF